MTQSQTMHASALTYQGAGCLFVGESGSGKSRLLAEALLLGAQMVADDQVMVRVVDGALQASAVEPLRGVLELRGLGLIQVASVVVSAPIHLVVHLGTVPSERLPEPQTMGLLGVDVPCVPVSVHPLPSVASLLLYLKAMQEGRILPTDWRPPA